MRKSIILTFLFSLWPGAGQMYLGYTKRGVSLMTGFLVMLGISSFFNLDISIIFGPVIWFFAFFDTWTIYNMDQAQRIAAPDDFLPHGVLTRTPAQPLPRRYHSLLGGGLILFGLYVLYNNLLMPLLAHLLSSISLDLTWLWRLCNQIPTLVVAVLLIVFGFHLVRRAPSQAPDEEWQYKGEE